jgi:hypothetical protein
MNIGEILKRLPAYKGKKETANERQGTSDIIREIEKAHKHYAPDYDKIALLFWKGNAEKTAKGLYSFLKNNVKYSIEPESRQSVKSPAAILATGQYKGAGNDCKHYSLFCGGVLDALNRKGKKIDYAYRFVNYRLWETEPQHVFIVLNPKKGNEIYIDAVLFPFNYKKPFVNGIDKKIKAEHKMPVYRISGIENEFIPDAYGQISLGRAKRVRPAKAQRAAKKAARVETRKIKKTARVEKRAVKKSARVEKRKEKGSLVSRTVLRAGLVIPRNAFLKAVALNISNFAYHLNESLKNPAKKEKLLQKWVKLGGKREALLNNVKKGIEKYKRKNPAYIGEPITAILASAAPIILALIEFLGKGAKKEVEQAANEVSPEQRAEITAQTKEAENMATAPAPAASGGQAAAKPAAPEPTRTAQETPEQETEQEPEKIQINKKYIIFGGVALAAIYLMRK